MHAEVTPSEPIEDLQHRMQALASRDLQLWSIGLLIFLVLAAGVAALVLPNVTWRGGTLRAEGRYLPQLFFGLITLIVLFNVYVLEQRRVLNQARQELMRQAMLSEQAEQLANVDPLTQLFNRRYLERVLPKETSRANRLGSSITFLMADLDDFKSVNTRLGHLAGDRLLVEVARLLQRTFRGSDSTIRYGGDEFLVMMPDTTEAQARHALARLTSNVERWNRESARPYQMGLSCGLASYSRGCDVEEVLRAADERMYRNKEQCHRASVAAFEELKARAGERDRTCAVQ